MKIIHKTTLPINWQRLTDGVLQTAIKRLRNNRLSEFTEELFQSGSNCIYWDVGLNHVEVRIYNTVVTIHHQCHTRAISASNTSPMSGAINQYNTSPMSHMRNQRFKYITNVRCNQPIQYIANVTHAQSALRIHHRCHVQLVVTVHHQCHTYAISTSNTMPCHVQSAIIMHRQCHTRAIIRFNTSSMSRAISCYNT